MSRAQPSAGAARPTKRKKRGARREAERVHETLDAERGQARMAGALALVSVACWIGALVFAGMHGAGSHTSTLSGGGAFGSPAAPNGARLLTALHAGRTDQLIAAILQCVSIVLVVPVAVYFARFVRARSAGRLTPWFVWAAVGAGVLLVVSAVFGVIANEHVATAFVTSGARTSARARMLVDGSGRLKVAEILKDVSRIALAGWVGWYAGREMLRVVLLDRFLGYWAFAAGGLLVLSVLGDSIGDAMFIAWLGSMGIVALGYWPGGRPEGWTRLSAPAG